MTEAGMVEKVDGCGYEWTHLPSSLPVGGILPCDFLLPISLPLFCENNFWDRKRLETDMNMIKNEKQKKQASVGMRDYREPIAYLERSAIYKHWVKLHIWKIPI